MMFAARKLQGVGLIVLLTVLGLLVYSVNLQVSTTRSALRDVEERIAEIEASNRLIEGDIAVLANARQLDRWNNESFGLAAANPAQFLQGERALANLDRFGRVPGARQAPVMVAAADTPSSTVAGGIVTPAMSRVAASRATLQAVALQDIAGPATPRLTAGGAAR